MNLLYTHPVLSAILLGGLGAVIAYLLWWENRRYWLEEDKRKLEEAKKARLPSVYTRTMRKILKGIKYEDDK